MDALANKAEIARKKREKKVEELNYSLYDFLRHDNNYVLTVYNKKLEARLIKDEKHKVKELQKFLDDPENAPYKHDVINYFKVYPKEYLAKYTYIKQSDTPLLLETAVTSPNYSLYMVRYLMEYIDVPLNLPKIINNLQKELESDKRRAVNYIDEDVIDVLIYDKKEKFHSYGEGRFLSHGYEEEHFDELVKTEEYQELLETPEFEALSKTKKYKEWSKTKEFRYEVSTSYSFNICLFNIKKIKKLINFFNTELAKSAQFKSARKPTAEDDEDVSEEEEEENDNDDEEEVKEGQGRLKSETGGGRTKKRRKSKQKKRRTCRKKHFNKKTRK